MRKKVLVSVTTIHDADWQKQIEDIQSQNIKEIALFVTGLDQQERQACYQLLEKIPGLEIPFSHIRSDVDETEINYLQSQFGTKKFNLHPARQYPQFDYPKAIKNQIYIENASYGLCEEDIEGFAGICLDLSHLRNFQLTRLDEYQNVIQLLTRFPAGANHVSAIWPKRHLDPLDNLAHFDKHEFSDLSQFDYLKDFPGEYFAEHIAIELSNPIKDQLEAKVYIENILKDKLG
jgi:hypothetical protein